MVSSKAAKQEIQNKKPFKTGDSGTGDTEMSHTDPEMSKIKDSPQ